MSELPEPIPYHIRRGTHRGNGPPFAVGSKSGSRMYSQALMTLDSFVRFLVETGRPPAETTSPLPSPERELGQQSLGDRSFASLTAKQEGLRWSGRPGSNRRRPAW